ncbi:MAG TPA: alpha/beta fold hydrolase [Candidatus Saccharimonadales bacterium]|nr:alpha/beta fold hydrolase [Candidatus Saccharimonadales bacterium]
MLPDLSYKYYQKRNAKTVYLVLHGGGPEGIETPFISNIINALTDTGNSVFGFNFPYCERGEESSSGEELTEEIAALDKVVQFLRSEGYEKIVIVAKSLGGITTSYWLAQHAEENVEVVVLGYVIGSVKTEALQGKLRLVIQGENDRFGNAEAVKEELAGHGVEAATIEVPKADHSYRNEQKEPAYQDAAIKLLGQKLAEL